MAKRSELIIEAVRRQAELIDGLPRLSDIRLVFIIDRDGRVKMRMQPQIGCGTVGTLGES